MAAAHRIARGCNPEEHIGWIAAAVARDIDPPRHIAGEGTLEEAFAGEPAERQYRPPLRDRIVDGCNHRDPAHRQHAKRAAAHAAGQMELIAPGLWHESDTPTEAEREHEREAAEWDPARNRPVGMPWGCAVAGGAT